jgi:hypothetical protein
MLIRNGIVLVEIEQQKQEKAQQEAIIYAATSRLRPILLTAFTTVLGLALIIGCLLPEYGGSYYVWSGFCYYSDAAGSASDLRLFP